MLEHALRIYILLLCAGLGSNLAACGILLLFIRWSERSDRMKREAKKSVIRKPDHFWKSKSDKKRGF